MRDYVCPSRLEKLQRLAIIAGFLLPTLGFAGPPASAETIVLQPGSEGKDTFWGTYYIKEGSPDYPELYNGGWADFYYNYLEFDLMAAPAADDVEKVEFHIYATAVAPNNPFMQVYRITQPWTEAGCNYWNNPASEFYSSMDPLVPGWNVVDITDLYRSWKNGTYPNHGIKLRPTRNNQTNGQFASSDHPTSEIRPKLVIEAIERTPEDGIWTELVPGGTPPPPRELHTAIFVPPRSDNANGLPAMTPHMIVFGGFLDDDHRYGDLWVLSLGNNPTWTQHPPAQLQPEARYLHTAVYDSKRKRMIVFGGSNGTTWLNDVWSLSINSMKWKQLSPAGEPPQGRTQHSAIYDRAGDRMIIYGAYHNGGIREPTWQLSFAPLEWTPLPAGPRRVRGEHSATLDPVRNRMIIFAGDDGPHPHENDSWALSLDDTPWWGRLVPTGTLPPSRWGHSAIYDPARDRLVIFGGVDEINRNFSDLWSMSLGDPPHWSQLRPVGNRPPARREHTAVFDSAQNRMILFGGRDDTLARRNDTWVVQWPATGDEDELPVPRQPTALLQNTPNPFNPSTVIQYHVDRLAEVRLEVFDVHGRLVKTLVRREQTPQTYMVEWDGKDQAGLRVPSGTYLYQLVVGDVHESRKMVILK